MTHSPIARALGCLLSQVPQLVDSALNLSSSEFLFSFTASSSSVSPFTFVSSLPLPSSPLVLLWPPPTALIPNALSLPLRLLRALLRLSRPNVTITAYPLAPVWSLVPAPTSGSSRRAPKHTLSPRSLILWARTLSETSGRPRLVPPYSNIWIPRG